MIEYIVYLTGNYYQNFINLSRIEIGVPNMKEIDGIYENGKISLLEQPNCNKSKVKIRFIKERREVGQENTFPSKKMGEMKKITRKDLYGEYLSSGIRKSEYGMWNVEYGS